MSKKFSFLNDDEPRKIDKFDWEAFRKEKQRIKESMKAFPHIFNYSSRYKVDITTKILILGKEMGNTQTECIWKISPISNNVTQLSISDKKYLKLDSQVKPMMDFIEKINKTTYELQLELNEDNTIKNVMGKSEILKKWEQIKFEDLKSYELENPSYKTIIDSYEKEFNTINKSINQNILYKLFFYPAAKVQFPNPQATCLSVGNTISSQLFAEQKIQYDLYCKSFIEQDYIWIRCASFFPNKWNILPLQEAYIKDFEPLTKQPFQYQFRIEGRYAYTHEYKLEKAHIYVKEQASQGLLYISEYKFSRLEEENIQKI